MHDAIVLTFYHIEKIIISVEATVGICMPLIFKTRGQNNDFVVNFVLTSDLRFHICHNIRRNIKGLVMGLMPKQTVRYTGFTGLSC